MPQPIAKPPVVRAHADLEPTAEEVAELRPGQYYAWGGRFYVQASRVGPEYLHFLCPFCWTAYKQDGQPKARARPLEHEHGSGGSLVMGREHRVAHCAYNDVSFFIDVTRNTEGVVIPAQEDEETADWE